MGDPLAVGGRGVTRVWRDCTDETAKNKVILSFPDLKGWRCGNTIVGESGDWYRRVDVKMARSSSPSKRA